MKSYSEIFAKQIEKNKEKSREYLEQYNLIDGDERKVYYVAFIKNYDQYRNNEFVKANKNLVLMQFYFGNAVIGTISERNWEEFSSKHRYLDRMFATDSIIPVFEEV